MRLIDKIKKIPTDIFATNLSFLTLLFLWFFNPSNKGIVVVFFILAGLIFLKSKNIYLSLLTTYLISSIIFTGKTHYYQLLDLKKFTYLKEDYPLGYIQSLVIGSSDIFAFLLFILLIKDLVKSKLNFKLNAFDLSLLGLLLWGIFDSLVISKKPLISLYFTVELFKVFILNLTLKFLTQKGFKLNILINILMVIIFFQCFAAIQQFMYSSPLGKNIEIIFTPHKFGSVVDEYYFTFRPPGTFYHANDLGIYLAVLTPLFISLYIISLNRIYLLTLVASLATIALTLSRSAWLGIGLALLYLFFNIEHKLKIDLLRVFGKKVLILALIFLPLIIYSLPRVAKSAYSFDSSGGAYLRIKQAAEIFGLVKASPVFGTGWGLSVVEAIEKNKPSVFASFPSVIHVYYLLLLAENGIIGLIFLFFIIFSYLKRLLAKLTSIEEKKQQIYLLGIIGGSLVLLITSVFQADFYFQLLIIFFYLKDLKHPV